MISPVDDGAAGDGVARWRHREIASDAAVSGRCRNRTPSPRQWISVPSNSYSTAAVAVAQVARATDDQIEHRLWIARRGRHRLQHVDGRGLMLDPLAVFAVALASASASAASRQRRVAFSPQFRVGALKFGDHVVLRRGHWPSPRCAPCRSAIGMHLANVKIVAMFPPGWPEP